MLRYIFLTSVLTYLVSAKSSSSPWKTPDVHNFPPPLTMEMELSEDGLSLMEPAIVPEPEDGGRWWYTPSLRAHAFSHRSKGRLIRNLLMSNKANEDLRLPGDILPYMYSIRLLPFIEEGNFTTHGHIEILVDCVTGTRNISMNAADITFDKLSISVQTYE